MSALLVPHIEALLQSNQLWLAREFQAEQGPGSRCDENLSTGFAALDAALPDHAWPAGQLSELICGQAGSGECSLMLPGLLAALAGKASAQLVLINPPHEPYLPAWSAAGITPERVLRINTSACAQAQQKACWAAEQALHCADVAAVVAWLPGASAQALRRLQLAASASQATAFVIRPLAAREQSSPAALRLLLLRVDALHSEIHILKSRGAAALSIRIELLSPALRALLQVRKQRIRRTDTVPDLITTNAATHLFRMTPRSQGIGLLPDALLIGNERAAEGPARSVKAHHGLDRTFTPNPISISTNITPAERALKREARHARSR